MNEDLSLSAFTAVDRVEELRTYIDALVAFDGIAQLRELKQSARALVQPSARVLDVGCGFGLETTRLAYLAGPGSVAGIDKSAHFIEEARRRAAAAGLEIDYKVGGADALPWPDASFDHVRAERLLIYFEDDVLRRAVAEMKRVLRPGGVLALIEPEFGTTTVSLEDRNLVRKIMAHEADAAVAQSWLPGRLPALLAELGFTDVDVTTRVVVFPPDLAAEYFSGAGQNAARDGAISTAELEAWKSEITHLHQSGRLFASEGFFLFMAKG
jgi:SAM-dependent methyltransferase